MRQVRSALTDQALERAGDAVSERILTLPPLAAPTAVGCYLSVRRELPTGGLIARLRASGHEIAVPRVIDRGRMEFRVLEEPLEPGTLGIPTSRGPRIVPAVLVCPGLAFDPRGGRLGYGAGHYDRWLADHPDAVTVGVCVDEA